MAIGCLLVFVGVHIVQAVKRHTGTQTKSLHSITKGKKNTTQTENYDHNNKQNEGFSAKNSLDVLFLLLHGLFMRNILASIFSEYIAAVKG